MTNAEFLLCHLSLRLLPVAVALERALAVPVLPWREVGQAVLCTPEVTDSLNFEPAVLGKGNSH